MEQNLQVQTTDELNLLFRTETNRFMKGIDKGLPFDELKEIRILLRAIEIELKKRRKG